MKINKPIMAGQLKSVIPLDWNDVLVAELEFQGNSVKIGDSVRYKNGDMITVEAIRLNPTPRIWFNGEWYLLSSCTKGEW